MNADREPNRLPLRAGAMLLFAVAVVFVGLGWHSAATSGNDPETALEAANRQTATTSAPAPTTSSVASNAKLVCVINAGDISGLAQEVTDQLKAQQFRTARPQNYTGGGFSENTIFYADDADKAQADKVNQALGGSYSVEERPSSFTMCRTGIAVIAIERAQ